MFFLESFSTTGPGEARQYIIHFGKCEEAKDCDCHDAGNWWSRGFSDYNEAVGKFEEVCPPGSAVVRCHRCFMKYSKRQPTSEIKVNVVVFAQGCVDPEITVTFDEDYAQAVYLEHSVELHDVDLLTWQECTITAPDKEALDPYRPYIHELKLELGHEFMWGDFPYKVIATTGDPIQFLTVLRNDGEKTSTGGREWYEITAGQYMAIMLNNMQDSEEAKSG
jgi:hypothetical protein